MYVGSIPILLMFCWSRPHVPSSSTVKNRHPKIVALRVKMPALELFTVPLYNLMFAGISKNKSKGPEGLAVREVCNLTTLFLL
jgi:hypothetical protein